MNEDFVEVPRKWVISESKKAMDRDSSWVRVGIYTLVTYGVCCLAFWAVGFFESPITRTIVYQVMAGLLPSGIAILGFFERARVSYNCLWRQLQPRVIHYRPTYRYFVGKEVYEKLESNEDV